MDGGSQIHGWLNSRPARFLNNKGRPGAARIHPAGPAPAFSFLKNLAGHPASQPFIWLPQLILKVYYSYWYIVGYVFFIMWGILCVVCNATISPIHGPTRGAIHKDHALGRLRNQDVWSSPDLSKVKGEISQRHSIYWKSKFGYFTQIGKLIKWGMQGVSGGMWLQFTHLVGPTN